MLCDRSPCDWPEMSKQAGCKMKQVPAGDQTLWATWPAGDLGMRPEPAQKWPASKTWTFMPPVFV